MLPEAREKREQAQETDKYCLQPLLRSGAVPLTLVCEKREPERELLSGTQHPFFM